MKTAAKLCSLGLVVLATLMAGAYSACDRKCNGTCAAPADDDDCLFCCTTERECKSCCNVLFPDKNSKEWWQCNQSCTSISLGDEADGEGAEGGDTT